MTHIDPVCGMTIEEEDAVGSHTHDGITYYFCNPSCLERFTADPPTFLEPAASAADAASRRDAIYTCPMHPEIVRDGPGACPICGMALEPRVGHARRRAESRARRHDAALLDRRGARRAGLRADDGRHGRRRALSMAHGARA